MQMHVTGDLNEIIYIKTNKMGSSVGEGGSRSCVVAVLLTGSSTGAVGQSVARRAACNSD